MRPVHIVVAVVMTCSSPALAGCGDTETAGQDTARPTTATTTATAASQPPATTAASSPTQSAGGGAILKTADSEFGPMLFDQGGQAIYLFDKENTNRPDCYGDCAKAWPPVLTEGTPSGRGQVRAKLLGTTERRDGSTQVTYAGHPLYFYAHEGKNQVLCHNITEFGGLWLVVTPRGSPAAA